MMAVDPDLRLNIWLDASMALCAGLAVCIAVVARARTYSQRLVALSLATTLGVAVLALMAEGTARPSLFDLALTLALLSAPGTLMYARLVELGL